MTNPQIDQAVRAALQGSSPVERAEIIRDVVHQVYVHTKFGSPQGGGLDGRDGPERDALAGIKNAAEDHYHDMLQQSQR